LQLAPREVRHHRSHLSCVAYDSVASVRQPRTHRSPVADPFCPCRNRPAPHRPESCPVLAASPAHASARVVPRPCWIPPDPRARMSAIAVVVRSRRISPPTRVGSIVALPLQLAQPHGALGNNEVGRAQTGQATVAGSCTVTTLVTTAARSASDTRAGSASPQDHRRALGQHCPHATAATLKP
jgi:hypothetical protein